MFGGQSQGFITPAVKNLIILNVIMFFISMIMGDKIYEALALFNFKSDYFRPVQLVTYMFLHGSAFHILFNMYSLNNLGIWIEYRWEAQRFLFFYLFCGIAAGLVHTFAVNTGLTDGGIDIPMVGASGAISGVAGAFFVLYPDAELMLMFIPVRFKAKYYGLIYVASEFVIGTSMQTGVAHFAHIGGLLVGAALTWYWRKRGVI